MTGPAPAAASDGADVPRRRAWRRAALVCVLMIAVAVAGLLARLLSGPVWAEWPAGLVADRIASAAGPGAAARVGVVGIALDEGFRPQLHLRDVLIDLPGTGSVSVDTVAATGSWGGPSAGVDRLVVDHVVVNVAADGGSVPPVGPVLVAVEEAVAAPRVRYLEAGSLTVFRSIVDGGRVTSLGGAAITAFARPDGGADVRIAGVGEAGPWTIQANAAAPGAEGRRVSVTTRGLDVADVAAMVGAATSPATGPIGFEGAVTLAGGRLVGGGGQLTVGPLVGTGEAAAPVSGGRSRLEVQLRPGARTLVLIPSPVLLPGGQVLVGGEIDVPAPGGTAWPFRLVISGRGLAGGEDRRGVAEVAGTYDPAEGLLEVDRMNAAGEGARFDAAMRVSHGDGHVSGALSGVFASMSVDVLKAIWPTFAVSDARRWVMEDVESGVISDATVDLAFYDDGLASGSGTAGATVRFRFDDLAFRSFDAGPMIRGASGTASLVDGRFRVDLERGRVDLGADGTLDLTRGSFTIPDVAVDPPDGIIDMSLSGDARPTLALWGTLPLAGERALPATPSGATGSVRAEVSLRLPLERDVPAEKVVYDARVRLSGLALAEPVDGRSLTEGDLDIRVLEGAAAIRGTARLDGVRAEIDLVESLEEGGSGSSAVRLRLTAADRRRLGVDFGDVLTGPVSVRVETLAGADGAAENRVEVDLADARLRIAALGIDKGKGKPGVASFTMVEQGGRIEVRDLKLEAGEARVSGEVTLSADGRLLAADLPRIAARAGDRLSLSARRTDGGVLEVDVRGERFDARRVVRNQLRGAGPEGAGDRLRLDVSIAAVTGFAEEELSGFNLDAVVDGGTVTALAMTTQTAGGGSASLTLMPAGATRRLEMEAGEVGRLLRFLGIYRRVYGGRAVVTGTVDVAGGVRASIDGSRLRIVDEPALARLSTAASTGPSAGIATVDIERLLFDIGLSDGRLVIADGVVRAATAGLSVQGDIDFNRETLRLAGTYLPASALDSLLGKIPLIGQTMFAGGRAGLLGVTFRLSGSIEEPVLTVNPLSAIAPGIFRKLFELR